MIEKKAILDLIGYGQLPSPGSEIELAYMCLADLYLDAGEEELSSCVRYMLANEVRPLMLLRTGDPRWYWSVQECNSYDTNVCSMLRRCDWRFLLKEHVRKSNLGKIEIEKISELSFQTFEEACRFIMPLVERDGVVLDQSV